MLTDFVRRRIGPSEVDDIVQSVLVDALGAARVPEDEVELRKWLIGAARHKIVDAHRRAGRERPTDLPEVAVGPDRLEERELARWAEREAHKVAPDAERTLGWLAREGDGEKLERIAEEERLPATTVRKRVSRLRLAIKERWRLELVAAAAVIGLLLFVFYRLVLAPDVPEAHRDRPGPTERDRTPRERAEDIRRVAIPRCDTDPRACLDQLDDAKRLDPVGDGTPQVQGARRRAESLVNPIHSSTSAPAPSSASTAVPWSTGTAEAAPPLSSSMPAPTASPTSSAFAPGAGRPPRRGGERPRPRFNNEL